MNGEPTGILLRMSDAKGLPPGLLSRSILEQYLIGQTQGQGEGQEKEMSLSKSHLTRLLKDTTLIPDGRLAVELFLMVMNDDQYGPWAECVKHSVGVESERHLEDILRSLGLTFASEVQLRSSGYDKTPDFKLDVPIGVDGHVVNWVESKALFGDPDSHQGYLHDQLWSYWNRFGPGLVIYWHGFVDTLEKEGEAHGILVRDSFPDNVVFMDPGSSL